MWITNLVKKLMPKTFGAFVFMFFAGLGMFLGIYFAVSFSEPIYDNSGFIEPENFRSKGNLHSYGRGWEPNASGSGSVELSSSTCEAGYGWYWFEDANGDGDYTDEEDGICVKGTSTDIYNLGTWNGCASSTLDDNSYIAAYTCAGNFPNGYVATYSGYGTSSIDNIWNDGDCALCQADCYDGKKDLPNQNGYTIGGEDLCEGPITTEILKNWTGTRLPTPEDYFGFCGYKDGSGDYATGCLSATTTGDYGQMVGRTDECIDASDSSQNEWLSKRRGDSGAFNTGQQACSYFKVSYVAYNWMRLRAVFRP